ncbi:hypothetical protein BZL39_P02850 [Zygosaccharomyces parabailii]|uniref:ZYBA0S15-01486g1_1 n=1 Tax=Zygosaccharomyces bailii (strain CLIB 213 / ATCC 58445 / CBS 680 / BCRC 21525 / NBRC 1098 / NCYC 1416 / NRRL Y-2227) TaxID=1333698 RepID=A0A8J2XEL6_ZYGB2|nr:hypothetical protein BZL39_H06320 [Zygosaccharomyces parabailii]AQZ19147.1 hypothetical protein BZL39_P02850 [Zygosaccharomyces parabailii]CDF91915.1 ZYBA0S15-01486g1_1 [Zygosaccharomyces bailii CLIB 213]CDH13857.1 related to JLP1-DnaJ-Like Protein 1 [Zygosaccharomyces bailii ISA1307]
MAPVITSSTFEQSPTNQTESLHLNFETDKQGYSGYTRSNFGHDETDASGILVLDAKHRARAKYPEFLPTWDPTEKYAALEFHPYEDPALSADPTFPNLFPDSKKKEFKVKRITPKLGSEIKNIQLSALSDAAKNELALFVAQRGVVVFRDQDLISKGPEFSVEFGKHFGRLHIHQTSGHPRNVPELHVVHTRPDKNGFENIFEDNINSVRWHSDVSYELQPPSYTFLSILEAPESGGDTLFADSVEAYERLSPTFKKFVGGLHVIHSALEQAATSKQNGGVQRRKPVANIHPLVREHPVLKKKSLYLNQGFGRRIVELKKPESDAVLNFLFDLVNNSLDLQIRANWEPGTVTVWDNRRVNHSASVGWDSESARHVVRITPQAERPVEDLKFLNDSTYYPALNSDEVSNH